MMRAVPHLLRARKDIRVVLVGADGVSYGIPPAEGTWREKLLAELGDAIDPARVLFPGRLDYTAYLALLQRSDAHVYLSYPFVASWSLREALATGCVVIGSDTPTVAEFVTHEQNGLLVPFFDPKAVADAVLARAGGRIARAPAARGRASLRREAPGDVRLHRGVRGADRTADGLRLSAVFARGAWARGCAGPLIPPPPAAPPDPPRSARR